MSSDFPGLEFKPVPCAYCHTPATLSRTPVVTEGNTRYVHAVLCNHAACPKKEHCVGGGMNESVRMWNEHMAKVAPTGQLSRRMYDLLRGMQFCGVKLLGVSTPMPGFRPTPDKYQVVEHRVACCPVCRGSQWAFVTAPGETVLHDHVGHDESCELAACIVEFEKAHPNVKG